MMRPGSPHGPDQDPAAAGGAAPVGDAAHGRDDARRTLERLRAQIDALDHDLLLILARRMALVAQVADVKRQLAMPIHDPGREGAVMRDWEEQARLLGLPIDEVAQLVHLLLRTSRDQQAAIRGESMDE